MSNKAYTLSILDQSVVRSGKTAREAVQETVEMVKLADRLGYHRFWVSEHHNNAMIAGSTPEVLMVKLAEATQRIRIGSGGIMLPNHSSLKVAENFRMLEVLYPGRIDLGIGRAPGTDRLTAYLLNPSNRFAEEDFENKLNELDAFFDDMASTEHGRILAIPMAETRPQQWLLTSGANATLAGKMGMGLGVPLFISGRIQPEAAAVYRKAFAPSESFARPEVLLALFIACADTEAKAKLMRKALLMALVSMDYGKFRTIDNYEEVEAYQFTPEETERIRYVHQNKIVSGTPEQVKAQLDHLAGLYEADEVMATVMSPSLEDKIRSFELMAETFHLPKLREEFH